MILKKDRVLSVALEEITNLRYQEKDFLGLLSKKGILSIETRTQKYDFSGKIEDVKIIWKEMQKHLGYNEPLGAQTAYTRPSDYSPTISEVQKDLPTPTDEAGKILRMRYAKGEITKEQYQELKKTLEEE